MADAEIRISPNGPYVILGSIKLVGTQGQEIPVEGPIALCRCGGSKTKPFCDGTHSQIGFQGAEAAVAAAEGEETLKAVDGGGSE